MPEEKPLSKKEQLRRLESIPETDLPEPPGLIGTGEGSIDEPTIPKIPGKLEDGGESKTDEARSATEVLEEVVELLTEILDKLDALPSDIKDELTS